MSKFFIPKKRYKAMKRCRWCNLKNELYIKYHDDEWCRPNFSDEYLYEMLILESFQSRTFMGMYIK